jgi:hypothetical protein
VARFYADEDVDHEVVLALRGLGHDVLTSQEAGQANRRIPDNAVLADAAAMARVLITRNRDDFQRLHDAGQFHCGLVLCGYDPEPDRQARLIVAQIEGQTPGAPWVVKVFRGHGPTSPAADSRTIRTINTEVFM